MQSTIQYLKTELSALYPAGEVESMTKQIIEWITGWDFTRQLINGNETFTREQSEKVRSIVLRLKKHEPLQYILGETFFSGLRIKVTPAVLIPRPETEELVSLISVLKLPAGCRMLDIGTGSGCIALALKSCFPEANVSACDISPDALAVARENSLSNKLAIDFFQADILNWNNRKWPLFDVIVSNPPYVTVSEKKQMQRNVLDFEPETALFVADNNPLLFYRTIAAFASEYLEKGGFLFFEINENFGPETVSMLADHGFTEIQLKTDLQGKDRIVAARKL
jgi:release factor glutamine methyltransferase